MTSNIVINPDASPVRNVCYDVASSCKDYTADGMFAGAPTWLILLFVALTCATVLADLPR